MSGMDDNTDQRGNLATVRAVLVMLFGGAALLAILVGAAPLLPMPGNDVPAEHLAWIRFNSGAALVVLGLLLLAKTFDWYMASFPTRR